jgi:APA family basic amino acid/polyamine antiporter
VLISFFVLRKRRPDMERPYTVPAYPLTPIIAIFGAVLAFLFSLVAFESAVHWALFVGMTLIGLVYYVTSVRNREIKDIMAGP